MANRPLQRPNALCLPFGLWCRNAAGSARGFSRSWYARGDRSAFAAERQHRSAHGGVIKTMAAVIDRHRDEALGQEGYRPSEALHADGGSR